MGYRKSVTHFSNGDPFGIDKDGLITGFKGINLEDLDSVVSNAASLMKVPTVASGGILAAHITDAVTHSIRIESAAGTKYYVMCTTTVTNRTGGG